MISILGGHPRRCASAPLTIDGDYVIAGTGVDVAAARRPLVIAYKLGAQGKLPGTAGS
jgi:hypothetical protein